MRIRPRYLIAFIVLLSAFVVGQWFFFKARFEAALPALEARAGAAGLDIGYSARVIKGFPFRLEAHYSAVRIARSDPLLSVALEADTAVLIRQLLSSDLSLAYFNAPRFAAASASPLPDRRSGEITAAFGAASLQMSLRGEGDALARVSAVFDQPSGRTELFSIGAFSAKQLQMHLGWPIEGRRARGGVLVPRVQANLQTAGLELRGRETDPLPPVIDRFELGLDIVLGTYAPLSEQGLTLWQAEDGKVQINALKGQWGDVTLASGGGAVQLDEAMRPKGNVVANVKGLAALTYAIDKTEILPPAQAEPVLLTLRLLRAGKKAEDEVPLRFDIDKGVLRLGPAPLIAFGSVVPLTADTR